MDFVIAQSQDCFVLAETQHHGGNKNSDRSYLFQTQLLNFRFDNLFFIIRGNNIWITHKHISDLVKMPFFIFSCTLNSTSSY